MKSPGRFRQARCASRKESRLGKPTRFAHGKPTDLAPNGAAQTSSADDLPAPTPAPLQEPPGPELAWKAQHNPTFPPSQTSSGPASVRELSEHLFERRCEGRGQLLSASRGVSPGQETPRCSPWVSARCGTRHLPS